MKIFIEKTGGVPIESAIENTGGSLWKTFIEKGWGVPLRKCAREWGGLVRMGSPAPIPFGTVKSGFKHRLPASILCQYTLPVYQ
mgnify:CR=1 FL=1